jgi:hypothetical protein
MDIALHITVDRCVGNFDFARDLTTDPSTSNCPVKVISPFTVVPDEIKVVPPADPPVDADSLRLRMVPLLILVHGRSLLSGVLGSR